MKITFKMIHKKCEAFPSLDISCESSADLFSMKNTKFKIKMSSAVIGALRVNTFAFWVKLW